MANAQIDNLLARVPQSANALVIIDAAEAQKTPLAKAQGWEARLEAANASRAMMLPPEADKIVVAAMLDPTSYFEPDWELGVVHLTETMSMRSIARAESGYVDKINGLDAAWTPSDAYFVSLDPHTLGIMSPANRQAVSRWAEFGERNQKVGLSGYLQSAAKLAGKQAPIVLAVDLKDSVQPHQLRKSLDESPLLKDKKDDVEKVAAVVSSIQGITLRIMLAKSAKGELRIDFGQSVAPLAKNAKPLVLEALDKFQAQLDELDSWSVSLDGNSILMKGEFTDAGLRRVLSLLELPTTKFSSLKDAPEGPATPDVVLKATKTYFSAVTSLVDELEKTLKNNKRDTHISWMEKYAKKIDRLPILNVDEEAVVFGACVAETFRGTAT
ncbi:MAG TPA: hypothetical protein VHB77_21705, partial [Planctomycetaceae bacterium]|nr:hypothetical protein [Planctomycetaceae bacterium]